MREAEVRTFLLEGVGSVVYYRYVIKWSLDLAIKSSIL